MSALTTQSHQPSGQQQLPWDSTNAPRFQTLKFLGKGGQGFVQLAYDNLQQQQVAIKYIDRGWSRGFYKYVLRETLNHQQLSLCRHPHIVEFHEVFLTPSYLAVVMEYVQGTNLQHYLESAGGKVPEDVARFIFQQLIVAVDFCHKKGKVNRDIKLANILLQEGHLPLVKLCDFGFSKDKFDDSEPQTQIGTALFTAPEIFTNVPGQVYDAEAADVWSCGVVLFVMLFGCHPFLAMEDTQHRKHAQVMKLIENAVRGNVQVPPGAEQLYPQALDLVRRILVSAPSQRCKLPAIMAHTWFQDKLPPGALLLNAAYLAMDNPVGVLRQTPEEVHAIITAALSVSDQDQDLTESTAAAPPGGGGGGVEGNTASASETSRAYSGAHTTPTSHPQHSRPQAGPGPQSLQSRGSVGRPAVAIAGTPQGSLNHGSLPMVQQPSGRAPQPLPPGVLLPQPGQLHLLGVERAAGTGMGQQAGLSSGHASASSHGAVAVAAGSSGHAPADSPAQLASGPGQAGFPHPGPPLLGGPGPALAPPPGSPLLMSGEAARGVSSGTISSRGGPAAVHTLLPDPIDIGGGVAAAAGGVGPPGSGSGGVPGAMDVSGCILFDSSLLYELDLQTEN